jgi:hypothetical protein
MVAYPRRGCVHPGIVLPKQIAENTGANIANERSAEAISCRFRAANMYQELQELAVAF